jgi:two-component system NarL family sensor kinase
MRVSFDYQPAVFSRLPREMETTIFRVIQEALTNVYRHSGSNEARIDLQQDLESVTVRVRDFGKGIGDFGKGGATLGVGISGMRERVKQLDGDLRVLKTEPGTLVEATLPLFEVVG